MPDTSPILSLPLIRPAQAQKHVTHNEALRLLDALVQLTVQNRDMFAPPALPTVGDRHIIAAAPTGAWAGNPHHIAVWEVDVWAFLAPLPGWQAFVLAEGQSVVWTGTAWESVMQIAPQVQVQMLGVNTTADATNKLAVAAAATLFTHAGAGHQMKLNKAGITDTASLLFQTGWSGRAEMGLAGTDGFSLKVSPDGTAFYPALQADPATGAITLPGGARLADGTAAAPGLSFAAVEDTGFRRSGANAFAAVTGGVDRLVVTSAGAALTGLLTGTAVTQTAVDTTAGRLMKVGDGGILGMPPNAPANIGVTDDSIPRGAWLLASPSVVSAGLPTPLAAGANSYLFHHRRVSTGEVQLLLAEFAPNDADRTLWFRRRTAGAWGNWKRMFDWGNILGTVSQASGVPTGAIIERGSNANGDYVRWADGTQMAWKSVAGQGPITTASGAGFISGTIGLGSLPATFIAAPLRLLGSRHTGGSYASVVEGIDSATALVGGQCRLRRDTTSSEVLFAVDALFIGRWF